MKIVETTDTPIIDYITERIMQRNQNFLACFTGKPGSGKTYGGLTLCESISERTGVPFHEENIVFSGKELMALINSNKLQKGSCILFDEAGVSYGNRDWQSAGNKMLNYLMQTFRHRNYVVVFTMPDFSFIDLGARKLFHARFETCGINYRRKLLSTKPLFIEVNQANGKMYRKYFRVREPGRLGFAKVKRMLLRLPSKNIVTAYEVKKRAFTDKLNLEIEASLKDEGPTAGQPKLSPLQMGYKVLHETGLCNAEISKRLNIADNQGHSIKRALRNKGIIPLE